MSNDSAPQGHGVAERGDAQSVDEVRDYIVKLRVWTTSQEAAERQIEQRLGLREATDVVLVSAV